MRNVEGVDFDNDAPWKNGIILNKGEDNLAGKLFKHFFPPVIGHAKLIDKHLSNENLSQWKSVRYDKAKFEEKDSDDSDWVVKQYYLIIVAIVPEVDSGADNLWKRGNLKE